MSAPQDGTFERIDPPRYVAFRKAQGDSTLAVIASLELRDSVGHQLGRWFSELTPNGDFRDVPVDAESYGINESIAEDLIDLRLYTGHLCDGLKFSVSQGSIWRSDQRPVLGQLQAVRRRA